MKNFFSYFIRSWRITFLIIAAFGIFGTYTAFTLPRESTPEIKIPIAVVVSIYPGSSSRDVEELVTNPLEDELANLEGVKQLTSTSQLGISTITVEFEADQDITESIRKLRESVDSVTGLPTEVERPTVIEINFSDQPILTVGLSGLDDTRLLSVYARMIADEVKTIPGVSGVDVVGERTEQIGITVNPQTLQRYGVSLGQIMQALAANNINAPFGQVDTGTFGYELRLVEKYQNVADVANTPIRIGNGSVVHLSDIASVKRELSDVTSESRISVNGQKSTSAVSLSVRKKTGGNIINIVDSVQAKIDELKVERLPQEIAITAFADQAHEIRRSLTDVINSGRETLIIVFAVLWLFLGWREALLASLSVPFTFFISFLVFRYTGTTLNNMSLFSLILALGMLVDDAIVIVDGMHARKAGVPLAEHAAQVVTEFFKPLTAGTLTTVAAFFPMLLVSGIIGQFLSTIPIVVSATLLSSLVVAVLFLPAVAVRFFGGHHKGKAHEDRWFTKKFQRFNDWYTHTIEWVLQHRKFQNRFIAILVILMVVGLSLPFVGILKTSLFPAVDTDFMIGNVELPPGSTKEATTKVMASVEDVLRRVPEIENMVLNIGASTSTDFSGGGSSSESLGSFYINLKQDRERSSIEITEALRGELQAISGAEVSLTEASAGPPSSAPVELRVNGSDLHELDRLSTGIMEELKKVDGAIEVDRNLKNSAGQFVFTLNREALTRYGLTASDLAQVLRLTVFGGEATNFLDEQGDKIKVQLSAEEATVNSVDALLNLPISTPTGQTIVLGQVMNAQLSSSIDVIRHRESERTITITAQVREGFNPNQVTTTLQERLKSFQLPAGYTIAYGGEQQETQETFTELYMSMIIAIVLIVMIMVVEFNSYRQPFIMFLSIPLALIGVLFGLVILGGELNFAAFIGLVSLTGIVVKNAILLVDRMNAAREEGKSITEAVRDSAASRLRPIMLTTLTTGLGIIPLVWVDEFFRDLALTIFTGLIFSTILTLGLIPILYYRQQTKLEQKGIVA